MDASKVMAPGTLTQRIDSQGSTTHNQVDRDFAEEKTLDARLRRLLQDLRGAITEALADSADVSRSMDQIRDEGWSVYLVIDRKREDETPEGIELTEQGVDEVEPDFRINSSDLAFLRSVGIDPTRRVRRRR